MSNLAWMPLDIGDYLKDTRHLTTLEHGAYLLLIMRYWEDGGLPDNEALIARYAGLTTDQWVECRVVLSAFFDDHWRHKRIDAELARATEVMEQRREASSNAAKKRWAKRDDASGMRNASKSHTETMHTDKDTDISSSLRSDDSAPAKPTPRQHLESVLDPDHAEAVIQHRQRIRKPMTERAAKMLAGDLAKFSDPNAAADRMILKGWSTIDVSWPDAWPGNSPRGSPPQRPATAQEILKARRQVNPDDDRRPNRPLLIASR